MFTTCANLSSDLHHYMQTLCFIKKAVFGRQLSRGKKLSEPRPSRLTKDQVLPAAISCVSWLV